MHRAIFLEVSRNLLPQKVLDSYCANRQWLQKILSNFRFKNTDTNLASPIVLLYGSAVSGTAFAQGDADFAVVFPNCTSEEHLLNNGIFHEVSYRDQVPILSDLLEHINERCSFEFSKPHRVFLARVPIIQYVRKTKDENLKFDLSLSLHGVENSLLIRRYMESAPQLRLGALCVKHWGKKMKLVDSRNGWISAYSLTIMYIFFMIRTGRISDPIDESEVSKKVRTFVTNSLHSEMSLDNIPEFTTMIPLQECDVEAVVHDVFEFFHFYGGASFFDFDVDVIDIRKNGTVKKKDEWLSMLDKLDAKERWHLLGYENIMMRDPYENHNLARSVDFFRGEAIREAFRISSSKKSPLSFLYDMLH
ncbi:unnamed protein product [Phytomonas sp. EM1]|nr:unnamed protein product [Phytomonas sp. EM1]|eukprot:CCW62907.1 unnamed protein product [Phytomonas sp. isolate EM1]